MYMWSESDHLKRTTIEPRKAKRYPLSAPVRFMWAPREGKPQTGQGVTRDINIAGVYIQTNALPQVGSRIQMEIALPKLGDTGPGMQLAGEGVVLRSEPCSATGVAAPPGGFAASIQFYPETTASALSQMESSVQVM
jgi:hypothetical protein